MASTLNLQNRRQRMKNLPRCWYLTTQLKKQQGETLQFCLWNSAPVQHLILKKPTNCLTNMEPQLKSTWLLQLLRQLFSVFTFYCGFQPLRFHLRQPIFCKRIGIFWLRERSFLLWLQTSCRTFHVPLLRLNCIFLEGVLVDWYVGSVQWTQNAKLWTTLKPF